MAVSRSYRLKLALLCLFTTSGFLTSATDGAEKISDQIDVNVSELRKSRARDQFQVDVKLKNTSDAAIAGPIVLVVKGTKVRGLVLTQPDGHLASGQAYLTVIKPKNSLKAGAEATLKGVSFDSSPLLNSDELEQFELQTDVYRIDEGTRGTAAGSGNRNTNPGSNLPATGLGQSNARGASGDSSADTSTPPLEPMPDPAFQGTAEQGVADPENSDGGHARSNHTTKRPRLPTDEEVASVTKIQDEWNDRLLEIEGVHTVGTGWGKDGSAVISVKVEIFSQKKLIPATVGGVPVETFVSPRHVLQQFGRLPDDYEQFEDGNRARGGVFSNVIGCFDSPRDFHPRASPIGVSGWNASLRLCATGTLGCRLVARRTVTLPPIDPTDPNPPTMDISLDRHYILSNSHVLANYGLFDLFIGQARVGDAVIQPGPADLNCAIAPSSALARLEGFSGISFTQNNLHDAAIALTFPFLFGTATPCDGYGVPRSFTVPPQLGAEVMKYGRTTRLTVGNIIGNNVTVDVLVDPVNGLIARYVGQVEVLSNFAYGSFSMGGDSGSLIVTRDGRFPVALLFAGNQVTTIGNPLDLVLTVMAFQAGLNPLDERLAVDGEPFSPLPPLPVP